MSKLLVLVPALVLLAGTAHADEKSCAQQRQGNPDAACQMSIDDGEELTGELPKWLGEHFVARPVAEHGSLIRWRTDFVDLIVKNAESL